MCCVFVAVHCIVPTKAFRLTESARLLPRFARLWHCQQRTEYKKFLKGKVSIITPERFAKLTEAGFVFEAKKRRPKRNSGDAGSDTSAGPTGQRVARRAEPADKGFDSDGSSTEGDERMAGGAFDGGNSGLQNYRGFQSFDHRPIQNTFAPWDRYNSGPGGRL
jgi:hypothetical protein